MRNMPLPSSRTYNNSMRKTPACAINLLPKTGEVHFASFCRYCLALLDVGNLKSSYIRGNSFHDGFNTAIGVFGTHELTVVDNVIHHTVGSSVRVWGTNNKVLRNLAVLSVSPGISSNRLICLQ